jgi:hypothetical protein
MLDATPVALALFSKRYWASTAALAEPLAIKSPAASARDVILLGFFIRISFYSSKFIRPKYLHVNN